MFDWIGSIANKVISAIIGGLAIIGIGSAEPVTYQASSTPSVVEIQSTSTLSEIDELRLALEQEKVERLKLEEKISASQNKPANNTVAKPKAVSSSPTQAKKTSTFTTPSGAVIDEAGNVISEPTRTAPVVTLPTVTAGTRILTGEEIYSLVSPSVVSITSNDGTGTGFIIFGGKYIITAAHVVGSDTTVQIKLQNGLSFNAPVLDKNDAADVALIFALKQASRAVTTGSSDSAVLKIGSDVYVLGFPLNSQVITLTKGVVSANKQIENGKSYVQTDATTHPGNSGGPLVNNKGEVVGIHTRRGEGTVVAGTGIALSIPIETALNLVPALSSYGQNRYEVYPVGSTLTIKRSFVLTITLNDETSCSGLGLVGNDLTLCGLYKDYYKEYKWSIIEDI